MTIKFRLSFLKYLGIYADEIHASTENPPKAWLRGVKFSPHREGLDGKSFQVVDRLMLNFNQV